MKKYLIQQTIEAEPMYQYEAEARMGREIDNNSREDYGYLTCDPATLQFDWVKESDFKGKLFDSPLDRMYCLHNMLSEWEMFFREHTKNNRRISQDERLQVYLINRHLKALDRALSKILNINALQGFIK